MGITSGKGLLLEETIMNLIKKGLLQIVKPGR